MWVRQHSLQGLMDYEKPCSQGLCESDCNQDLWQRQPGSCGSLVHGLTEPERRPYIGLWNLKRSVRVYMKQIVQ